MTASSISSACGRWISCRGIFGLLFGDDTWQDISLDITHASKAFLLGH